VLCEQKSQDSPAKRQAGSRIPEGKVRTQAIRYPTESWTEEEAREHCASVGGSFEAAAKEE